MPNNHCEEVAFVNQNQNQRKGFTKKVKKKNCRRLISAFIKSFKYYRKTYNLHPCPGVPNRQNLAFYYCLCLFF